jgi:hypothetical protein
LKFFGSIRSPDSVYSGR